MYVIYSLQSLKKPADDGSNRLMLEMIENLRKSISEKDEKSQQHLQNKFDKIVEHLNQHQHRSIETMQKQFGQSAKIIEEVTKKLTKLDETNKQVVNFADQMRSLENILKNPKHRGVLGEYFLESLLGNVLAPGQYKMQYKFKDNEIVDAVIFFKDKLIPIDSKFSLEKYNMIMNENDKAVREKLEKEFKADLKLRIDETSKYIRPEEDTTDFAFMFIPAEGIFYNLLVYNVGGTVDVNSTDLVEYAFKKHVIIVSPTSFFAYLETVLQGLKALKMEESVKEIITKVGSLGRHLNSYETYMSKLGNNLGTTVNMYNNAAKEFKKIDKDVYKISGNGFLKEENIPVLEKPEE
ncbi:DNA recombination protein RmuC [Candidatus Peregrinibacteria bacterium]|nr:DNA recombination protein RmuC [Candidatus Peregrinibacteria bacterium]